MGKTTWGWKRIVAHCQPAVLKAAKFWVDRWIATLGGEMPGVMVLEEIPDCEDLDDRIKEAEVRLIRQFRKAGFKLTNLTDGGEGMRGYVYSAESRAKMSAKSKGRKFSVETKALWSKQRLGNKNGKRRPVFSERDGVEFESAAEAGRHYGLSTTHVLRICKKDNLYGLRFM